MKIAGSCYCLFDSDQDIFLGAEAKCLGIIKEVGAVAFCNASLHVYFAMVGGIMDSIDTCPVECHGIQ